MTASTASTLVFVDLNVANHEYLTNGVKPGNQVVLLDAAHDGVEQITATLAQHRNVKQIHIVSHGNPGLLQLGSSQLDGVTLQRRAAELHRWSTALTARAQIFLYGCQVAATAVGEAFVRTLAGLTGAEVNASKTLMGHWAKGGNWEFEFSTGDRIKTGAIAFEPAALQAFPEVLITELVREDFRGSDVDARPWISNPGSNTSAGPFLTARTGVDASVTPEGQGLPGAPVALDPDGEGALRLTGNQNFQSAFVIYDDPIPSNAGLQITFELYAYNSTSGEVGADGISFFLIDGNATPEFAGGYGGSLGYGNITPAAPGVSPEDGIEGGYVGIGFDEFGNFSNPTENRVGGPGFTPDSIAIRGSESQNYRYLRGTGDLGDLDSPTTTNREEARRTTRINLTVDGLLSVELDLNNNGTFETDEVVIQPFNLAAENGALPDFFKFGFAASTGSLTNIHEIRNLLITTTVDNQPPSVTDVTLSAPPNSTIQLTGLSATDPDGTIDFVAITALPPADQGTLYLGDPNAGGTAITTLPTTSPAVNGPFFQLTPDQINQLYFVSSGTFTGVNLSYTAVDNLGFADETPGQITINRIEPGENIPPVVTNSRVLVESGDTRRIPDLSATDPDGSVQFVALLALPDPADGTLFLRNPDRGGVPITELTETSPLVNGPFYRLTPGQLGQLFFRSTSGRTENTEFALNYVAIDDRNAVSNSGRIDFQITATGTIDDPNCAPGETIAGTPGNDTLVGGALADTIRGFGGRDILRGLECNDLLYGGTNNDRIFGNTESDTLFGRRGNDQLFGGQGSDILRGGLGRDRMDGGLGNDRLRGGADNDRMFGRFRDDVLRGNLGDDFANGGGGDDQIFGGPGDDTLVGGPGDDFVRGQTGNDRILGKAGDDELRGGLGRDQIIGFDGSDLIRGGRGNDRLFGRRDDDIIFGNASNDLIRGARGNDLLDGGEGQDRVNGGNGNDVIAGGLDRDTLIGGGGSDRFTYSRLRDRGDTITDFTPGQDLIDLSALFARARFQAADPFAEFIRLRSVAAGTQVQIDRNGNQPGSEFRPLVLLQGVAVDTVSVVNFVV